MPISFNQIPSNIRVPLAYIEFDNTRAVTGTPQISQKILAIGQRLTTGTVAAGVLTRITSAAQAEGAFGRGSMLSAMFNALKASNRFTESWAIALDDAVAGVAATGTITFAGTVTLAGTLYLYIAGKRLTVTVAAAEAAATTATNVAAAINAATDLPVTATSALGVVTVAARHKGEAGNTIDVRTNYYDGETLPAGLTATIVAMASGATNPDIATAISAMGPEWWNHIVMPYTDTTNLTALETELNLRWGPTKMIDAIAYSAYRGTLSATSTFGNGRNHHLVTYMGTGIAPQPPYIWAAVYAGIAAASLAVDPARPLQTLELPGLLPPKITDRWTLEEHNILLYDGIATFLVNAGGTVSIERAIT